MTDFYQLIELIVSDGDFFEFRELDEDKVHEALNQYIDENFNINDDNFEWEFTPEEAETIRNHFRDICYRGLF